jgi:glutathione S-transferase
VPVVRFGKEVVAGSARIIDELERRHPSPALYPQEPAQRARALEIQQQFDTEVGPKVRRALFSVAIDEGDWTCAVFSTGKSAPMRALYRAMFPVTQQIMIRSMNLRDRVAIDDSMQATARALDFVAKETRATGYLVGDAFSVADLTAAALLVVLAQPDHPDMRRPEPIPPRVQEFLSRWASHPGVAWVLEQYRRHRPPPQAV